jgi:histone deacetylase 6
VTSHREILSKAENSRTGQPITAKQAAHFEASEQKHEEDLERVRLRNISLRTTFRKLERTLRAREQLAEGLHMIDFEQLKIENQTLNEKIEERNEDLAKLKRKKTTTVQVLTHIREKLRFVEQANENLAGKLAHLENTTTDMRNIVTSDKLYRDELRAENKELRAKQGFATSDLLLVDYEGRCAKVEQLKAATTELKDRYGILMRQVNKSLKSSTSTPWVASQSNSLK